MTGETPFAFHGPAAGQWGGGNTQHNHFHAATAPAPATLPHQVGVIPPRAQSFQHRAETRRLRAAVADGGTAAPGQVLTGMGGVGKTQLAADYAHTAWDRHDVDVMVWVTAVSRTAIVSGYARAAAELCAADPGDPERAAAAFLAWLRAKPHRWLVVLDDIADPADVRGLWPPATPHGHTLATTRRRDAALTGAGRRRVDVGLFTAGEAADYLALALAAHGRAEPAAELAALAADLGHLPLALSQAAAYLIDQALTPAAYRALLADRSRTLADAAPEGLPDDQSAPVAAAWSLSTDLADTLQPAGLARPLLRLASTLDPNGIPQAVLTSGPAVAFLAEQVAADAPATTAPSVVQALRVLHRLSLIDHTPDDRHREVRVHALVQRATRDILAGDQRGGYARAAAGALLAAWPAIERDTDLVQSLRANTAALTALADDALYHPDAHDLLFRLGRSLGGAGQLSAAIGHLQGVAATAAEQLGPDHPDVLDALQDLANWRREAGDAAGAVAVLTDLISAYERVRGPDHRSTLAARHILATSRSQTGDVAGAVEAFEELLADCVRVLGPEHPETLATRSNLASRRGDTGDAAGAAAALVDILADYARLLGPDDPGTLTARNNLAHWRGEAGDAAGAAEAYAELLADRERVLGPDHPYTFATRSNLANWQGEAGDAVRAVAGLAGLLLDEERVLGPDHPDTHRTRRNLAVWRHRAHAAAGAAGGPAGAP